MSIEIIVLLALWIVTLMLLAASAIMIIDMRTRTNEAREKFETAKELNEDFGSREVVLTEQNIKLTSLNVDFNRENSELKDSNYDLATLNEEYSLFIKRVHTVLDEDVGFLQGELAQKLSLDIPEVRSLNLGLQRLRDDMSGIKDVVEEFERIKDE